MDQAQQLLLQLRLQAVQFASGDLNQAEAIFEWVSKDVLKEAVDNYLAQRGVEFGE